MTKEKLAKKAIMDELLKKHSIYDIIELVTCFYQIAVGKGIKFTDVEKDNLDGYIKWGLKLIKDGEDSKEAAIEFFRDISCNLLFAIAIHK